MKNIEKSRYSIGTLRDADAYFEALEGYSELKDCIYRRLWAEHVKEDVEGKLAEEKYDNIPADSISEIVESVVIRYVYNGDYDCNLSYWDNIENLLDEEETQLIADSSGKEG